MYNEEIYQKLLEEFGEKKMLQITDIISVFYDIKYQGSKDINLLNEYDYERDWWIKKSNELLKLKEII